METLQKWLMHVQPMHERLPHHHPPKVQSEMQLCEFAWHANQIEIDKNEEKKRQSIHQQSTIRCFFMCDIPVNVHRHEHQCPSMHRRMWIL